MLIYKKANAIQAWCTFSRSLQTELKNEQEKDGLNERMGKMKRIESEGENVWAIWTDTRCVQLVWNQTEWVGWIF